MLYIVTCVLQSAIRNDTLCFELFPARDVARAENFRFFAILA
jgi:hypothetical protein